MDVLSRARYNSLNSLLLARWLVLTRPKGNSGISKFLWNEHPEEQTLEKAVAANDPLDSLDVRCSRTNTNTLDEPSRNLSRDNNKNSRYYNTINLANQRAPVPFSMRARSRDPRPQAIALHSWLSVDVCRLSSGSDIEFRRRLGYQRFPALRQGARDALRACAFSGKRKPVERVAGQ